MTENPPSYLETSTNQQIVAMGPEQSLQVIDRSWSLIKLIWKFGNAPMSTPPIFYCSAFILRISFLVLQIIVGSQINWFELLIAFLLCFCLVVAYYCEDDGRLLTMLFVVVLVMGLHLVFPQLLGKYIFIISSLDIDISSANYFSTTNNRLSIP